MSRLSHANILQLFHMQIFSSYMQDIVCWLLPTHQPVKLWWRSMPLQWRSGEPSTQHGTVLSAEGYTSVFQRRDNQRVIYTSPLKALSNQVCLCSYDTLHACLSIALLCSGMLVNLTTKPVQPVENPPSSDCIWACSSGRDPSVQRL